MELLCNEKIFRYQMNKKDEVLAEMAETIIKAYAPDLLIGEYKFKHTSEGFSFIVTITEQNKIPIDFIITTNKVLSVFVEHLISILSKKPVDWHDIYCSNEVIDALQNKFGSDKLFIQFIPEYHLTLGNCLACGTVKGWCDGYYQFGDDGKLVKII